MRTKWSEYELSSGLFTGRQISGPTGYVPPASGTHAYVEGSYHRDSAKVDLSASSSSSVVISYKSPQPSPDHEWNEETKRWVLTQEAAAKINADAHARASIQRIEAGNARTMREVLLALLPEDHPMRSRLQEADDEIRALRANILQKTP